jgi:hypothetical protein
MATTENGKWSTAMNASPSSGHGVSIFHHGIDTGWDIVVQIAPINSTNLSGATQPVWYDVTARVVDISWDDGDPALESRQPINSASYTVLDISDIVGDPMSWWESRADRFGSQCLIRHGFRSSGGGFSPMFSGVIDTVVEDWSPGAPRSFTLTCFDVMYVVAGHRANGTYGTLGTTIEGAFMGLMTNIDYPFTRTMFGTPVFSTWDVAGLPAPQAPLQLLHRIADSGGSLVTGSPAGRLEMYPWGYSTQAGSGWTVVDGRVFVDSDPAYALPAAGSTILATRMRWVNSVDQMVYNAFMSAPNIVGGNYSSTLPAGTRYRQRVDRADWPKTDLLNDNAAELPDNNAAALRAADPLRLDMFTVDTQTADQIGASAQQDLATLITFLCQAGQAARWYYAERRTRGLDGWWRELVATRYASHYITRAGNQFRWIADLHPRWFPYA